MTIQPNNQAPKFQDPAETPDRTAENTDKKKAVLPEGKPTAKHGLSDSDADSTATRSTEDSAVRKSRQDETSDVRKSSEKSSEYPSDVKNSAVQDSAAKDSSAVRDSAVNDSAVKNEAPVGSKKGPEDLATAAQKAPENKASVAARTRLFEDQEVTQFREQWRELQAGFVDEPRGAVREADTLVSQMMDTLTSQLAEQKRSLQSESDAVDTEQLRVALQRYRSLFDQMLQV